MPRGVTRIEYADGTLEMRFELAADAPRETWAGWRRELGAAGATLSGEREEARGSVATVAIGGHRYFASMARGRSSDGVVGVLREAARVPVRLTGPCVAIPEITFRTRVTQWVSPRRQADFSFSTDRSRDLDRDGIADALVPLPRAREPQTSCPDETRWEVYLVRGSCGHSVGIIEGEARDLETSSTSHGVFDLSARITPRALTQGPVSLRYAFDGQRYVEVEREQHQARCDVHPADCRDPIHSTCALRDHPTILSHFDADAATSRLSAAAEEAQRVCLTPSAPTERCDVRPTFAPDGRVSHLVVRDCPRRRACVAPIFRALTITPYVGEAAMPSISFQIPAP
jgi:hypothetical protein